MLGNIQQTAKTFLFLLILMCWTHEILLLHFNSENSSSCPVGVCPIQFKFTLVYFRGAKSLKYSVFFNDPSDVHPFLFIVLVLKGFL